MVKLLYFMKLADVIVCTQEELASQIADGDEIAFSPMAR